MADWERMELTMARRGRKPKLNEHVQRKICRLIKAGHFQSVAARAAGVSEATFYRWLAQGSEPNAPRKYREFQEAVSMAIAESERILLNRVLKEGGPREALEVMKRRFPERWGDRQRLEHTSPEGEGIAVNHSGEIGGPANIVNVVIANVNDTWQPGDDPGELIEEENQKRLPGAVEMPEDTEL